MMNLSSKLSQEEECVHRWDDPKVQPMKMLFVKAVANDKPSSKINFRSLFNDERVEDSDFVLPREAITMAENRFANSLVGYFVGKPIMLDAFTSEMCANPWGRLGFARDLIEVSADNELKKEVIMAVPNDDAPKTKDAKEVEENNDGFTTIHRKKECESNSQKSDKVASDMEDINLVKLKINFDALRDQDDLLRESNVGETSGTTNDKPVNPDPDLESYESEIEELIMEPDNRGLNRAPKQYEVRQVVNENQLSVCAILESHVDISALSKACSKVFHSWDWTSNAGLCDKGYRIIIGWNTDVVNLRMLWNDLGVYKNVVYGFPWVLMGDFNAALNMEDYYSRSSTMSSEMIGFKDCVANIEVMDINSTGIPYTWNQKPKRGDGVLKKLDGIMGNIEFCDVFQGAYAVFQPYRISDHSGLYVISNSWNVSMDGYNMFKVVSKLKALKKPLRKLVYDQGNLHERVNKLRLELDEVQKALDTDP
ncbi:hypothetical protein Tco_1347268 [Tanacetum coccineum]